jgi:acetylornithine deacetylase/succinyl-diaminopimelate desuccinylase-like protein
MKARVLGAMLARRGFRTELLETTGNPLVWGEMRVAGATRTLLLNAHYSGQPASLATRQRFQPDWRASAPSGPDDESPIAALCAAIDALRAAGRSPTSNLRVVLDGEEEDRAPTTIPLAIARYRDRLVADMVVVFDGPVHPSGRPTLIYGAHASPLMSLSRQLAEAMRRTFGEEPVQIGASGASPAVAPFIEAMGFPAIAVPIATHNDQPRGHENRRLGGFFRSIVTVSAVLTM